MTIKTRGLAPSRRRVHRRALLALPVLWQPVPRPQRPARTWSDVQKRGDRLAMCSLLQNLQENSTLPALFATSLCQAQVEKGHALA